MAEKFKKCGHPRTPENSYWIKERWAACKICVSHRSKKDYEKRKGEPNFQRLRREARWRHYGIELSVEQYDLRLNQQNGVCAICFKPPTEGRKLSPDHNHETGQVRGLLCDDCNTTLGKMQEDENRLMRMIDYLRFWNGR